MEPSVVSRGELSSAQDEAREAPGLLRGLPIATREAVLRHSVVHSVGAGTVLFEQGETPNFQHALLSGSIHLFGRSSEAREVLIDVVEPPDLVIPAAVMTASPYLVRARVLEPTKLLMLEARAFRDAVAHDPALAQIVIQSLAGQFRRMVRQIKNLKLRSSNQRVGCYILALSRRQGRESVVLPYEKNLIASELGVTRESFSRALAALSREGVVIDGDRISIVDRGKLEAACGPDPLIDPDEGPAR